MKKHLPRLMLGCTLVALATLALINCTDPTAPAKFTVKFSMNGGVPPIADIIVEANKKLTKPSTNPKKEDHTFVGWYKDIALTMLFDFTSEVITRDITLYAKWAITTYTVTFNSNQGSKTYPQTVESGKKASRPTDPTREGHAFENWYSDEALTTVFDFDANTITQNITLYAKWVPEGTTTTYTVTFNYNDGDPETDLQKQVNQGQNVEKPNPTRTGYTLENWYSDEALTTVFDFDANAITQDITLYAKWVPEGTTTTYTVTFNYNDGDPETDLQKQVNQGQNVEKPNPTRTGYTLENWYSDEALTTVFDFDANTITQDITLYAKWDIITYTVTFDYNNGDPKTDLQKQVNQGQNVEKPNPTRTGYTLENWYSDEALTTVFDFDANTITQDITLYAKWSITTYTVTFNYNDGDPKTDLQKQVNQGQNIEKPNPTRTGYTLENWYSDEALTTVFDFDANAITRDITLYAKWDATAYYTVTFNYNDGDPETDLQKQVNQGQNIEKPNPTRTGYTLENWYSDETLTTVFDFDANAITQDITLYAKWDATAYYTVTFNYNDGDPETDLQKQVNQGQNVEKPNPTRTGYTLENWYSDEALTTVFDFDANAITQDITLYAKWSVATYTVIFNSNGGTNVEQQTIEYKKTASKPADPIKNGYTLEGWYNNDVSLTTAFDFDADSITQDITLYAKWDVSTYTVSFNSNGGTDIEQQTIEYKKTASRPNNPTKASHAFKGWYGDAALTTSFDFDTETITRDTTLYAKWARLYTVTFQSNGGSAVDSAIVEHGQTVPGPANPTREGYRFSLWSSDFFLRTSFHFAGTKITSDITLYAKWQRVNTITFNSNGGTDVEPQIRLVGSSPVKPSNDPTKEGYAFKGWYGDAALTTPFIFYVTPITGDITLYAKWAKLYTVTFESNGGSEVENDTIASGDFVTAESLVVAPTRKSYTFLGWHKDVALTVPFAFRTEPITGDITLYAKWREKYTVTFDSNGGSTVENDTITSGARAVRPANPTKEGHGLLGWYKDAALTMLFDFGSDVVTGDMTLYAKWAKLNIPDARFRAKLKTQIPGAFTGEILNTSSADVTSMRSLNVSGLSIQSLKGVEHFTALTSLNCSNNSLSTLDVSSNAALTELNCSENSLNILDVSSNTALTELNCSENSLSTLDVSSNTALTELNCSENSLSTLDVSSNTALTELNCSGDSLNTLDVSSNTALTELNCSKNSLSTLDVSSNTALTELNCSNNSLSTLDVLKDTLLTSLNCSNNQLSRTLNIGKNTALITLYCNNNNLIELDVESNPKLRLLYCHNNDLITLSMRNIRIARYLSIFADEDDEKTNVIRLLKIHDDIKDASQIRSAKTYRGNDIEILTYTKNPSSGDYVSTCYDYDPNANNGQGACNSVP